MALVHPNQSIFALYRRGYINERDWEISKEAR